MSELSLQLNEDLRTLYGGWIKRTALYLKVRMPWADLDELLQSGAIGMLEALKRYDTSHGVEFAAFAARRIRGAMIDSLRRDGMRRRGECQLDTELVDSSNFHNGTAREDPLSHLLRADSRAALIVALQSLPPLEYRVLTLHFYEEMNNREIAAILGISEGYASRVRKRALTSLAVYLTPQFNGETV
ncbi:MAG: sigma-70 family RNA polymerase sigma factor [Acidocella sp.]|nr:sigma-70 family RNA polymerase sigma factor [Acidocella sp.]